MIKLTEDQWAEIEKEADQMRGSSSMYMHCVGEHLRSKGMIIRKFSEDSIKEKMEQAHAWLLLLDVPSELVNKMCIFTFLALCAIKPDTPWKESKAVNMSLSKDIMTFIADNYNVAYKSSTRESFRREGINILINHGIIDLNPGNPHLGPNSPLTHYAIKQNVLKKIIK